MIATWLVALMGSVQGAQTPTGQPAEAVVVESHWYGAPAVGVDIASAAVVVLGLASPDHRALIVGAVGYGLGAPVNHLVHNRPGRAAISLGARALAALLVWPMLYDHVLSCDAPTCHNPEGPLALSALLTIGVMAADDLLLAREPLPTTPRRGAMIAPGILARPGAAMLSFTGRF